jgi:hypothetical protein
LLELRFVASNYAVLPTEIYKIPDFVFHFPEEFMTYLYSLFSYPFLPQTWVIIIEFRLDLITLIGVLLFQQKTTAYSSMIWLRTLRFQR